MSKPKIFVSSTCEDQYFPRKEIRDYILRYGFEPIFSDYDDVSYNNNNHTHVSCINAVSECDMLIFIIGGRFGGKAIEDAYQEINFNNVEIKNDEFQKFILEHKVSVTQMEVMKALECDIPVYTLIEKSVYASHHTYELNKENKSLNRNDIKYGAIEKDGTAPIIFEFFNVIRKQSSGNNFKPWHTTEEIFNYLTGQWTGLFKDQLKYIKQSRKKYEYINSTIVDHNSLLRKNAFDELFTEIDEKDTIKILGTGVTKFLKDTESVETFLKNENHIKILLVNDQMIKSDWACSSKQFIDRLNEAFLIPAADLITELQAKTYCPLAVNNILVDKNHFNNYYQRDEYSEEVRNSYALINTYQSEIKKKNWKGTLEVKHFHSFIPMSITAVFPDHSSNKKLLVEFIIPFTENRILFKSSLKDNKNIYNVFIDFFDETWKRAKEL